MARQKIRTMSIVFEVEELVVPLGDNPQCIFDECADDQEASCSGYISISPRSTYQQSKFTTKTQTPAQTSRG